MAIERLDSALSKYSAVWSVTRVRLRSATVARFMASFQPEPAAKSKWVVMGNRPLNSGSNRRRATRRRSIGAFASWKTQSSDRILSRIVRARSRDCSSAASVLVFAAAAARAPCSSVLSPSTPFSAPGRRPTTNGFARISRALRRTGASGPGPEEASHQVSGPDGPISVSAPRARCERSSQSPSSCRRPSRCRDPHGRR